MKISKFPLVASGAVILIASVCPASAQDSLASCADIGNADERLACYDRAAENAKDLPVVRLPRTAKPAPAPDAGDGDSPGASTASRQDDFGLELKRDKQRDPGPETRSYRVLAASHNDFTGWTIEFEDGGTWKQVGTDDYDINVGETYTIRRASFNSYFLSNARNSRKIRITRVE